jgi:hypothetical protein
LLSNTSMFMWLRGINCVSSCMFCLRYKKVVTKRLVYCYCIGLAETAHERHSAKRG